MNLPHVAAVLVFVLILGAMLVDLIWHCAPRRGKWPHLPQRTANSRARRLQNAQRVAQAQMRRAVSSPRPE